MKNYILIFLYIVLSLPIISCTEEPKGLISVSHSHLISDPQKYVDHQVIVNGFVKMDNGFLHLYKTKEDMLASNQPASIWVRDVSNIDSISALNCVDGYVEVKGMFGMIEIMKFHGITNVESIRKYDLESNPVKSESCWPKSS